MQGQCFHFIAMVSLGPQQSSAPTAGLCEAWVDRPHPVSNPFGEPGPKSWDSRSSMLVLPPAALRPGPRTNRRTYVLLRGGPERFLWAGFRGTAGPLLRCSQWKGGRRGKRRATVISERVIRKRSRSQSALMCSSLQGVPTPRGLNSMHIWLGKALKTKCHRIKIWTYLTQQTC